jgi:lysine-N-methylase
MTTTAVPSHTAFRYMTRFRCIGGDCESSCCSGGWRIGIDRAHYEKTKSAMGQTPALRREFDAKVTRVKGVTDDKQTYALIVLQPNGNCSFLGEDRLCGLQKRYGEEVLSDTCALYPRTLLMSAGRRELAGVASCPEVARQLLLAPDAMELDQVPASTFTHAFLDAQLGEHPKDPYTRYHDELRSIMFDLLSDAAYPLSTRLSFMAYFANRTRAFLYRGAAELDEPRLLAEVERIQNRALRTELHVQLGGLPVEPTFAQSLVLGVVGVGAQIAGFRALLDKVIGAYTRDGAPQEQGAATTTNVSAIIASFEEHKRAWAEYAPRIDAYLSNYAKNYWAREWYFSSPNLLMHSVQLLLRMATIRFLLFGNPLLQAAVTLPGPERELSLSKAVVQTVQQFSRVFEHSPKFTLGLQERLASSNVVSLAHAICLAKF